MTNISDAHGHEPNSAVAAVRAELMNGLTTVDVFAEAIGKTPRQIQNWISEGMPHVRYGKKPFVVVTQAKDWLLSRSKAD